MSVPEWNVHLHCLESLAAGLSHLIPSPRPLLTTGNGPGSLCGVCVTLWWLPSRVDHWLWGLLSVIITGFLPSFWLHIHHRLRFPHMLKILFKWFQLWTWPGITWLGLFHPWVLHPSSVYKDHAHQAHLGTIGQFLWQVTQMTLKYRLASFFHTGCGTTWEDSVDLYVTGLKHTLRPFLLLLPTGPFEAPRNAWNGEHFQERCIFSLYEKQGHSSETVQV